MSTTHKSNRRERVQPSNKLITLIGREHEKLWKKRMNLVIQALSEDHEDPAEFSRTLTATYQDEVEKEVHRRMQEFCKKLNEELKISRSVLNKYMPNPCNLCMGHNKLGNPCNNKALPQYGKYCFIHREMAPHPTTSIDQSSTLGGLPGTSAFIREMSSSRDLNILDIDT